MIFLLSARIPACDGRVGSIAEGQRPMKGSPFSVVVMVGVAAALALVAYSPTRNPLNTMPALQAQPGNANDPWAAFPRVTPQELAQARPAGGRELTDAEAGFRPLTPQESAEAAARERLEREAHQQGRAFYECMRRNGQQMGNSGWLYNACVDHPDLGLSWFSRLFSRW